MKKSKDKKLVVVADDFGWTKSVSDGILKSYQDGIVTEASLMVDCFATDYAVKLFKKHKIKDIGLHILLVGPGKSGRFLRRDDYIKLFKTKSYAEIQKLARDELDGFEKLLGYKPTHLCPHYGIHGNFKLLSFLIEYARENDIPVRIPRTALMGGFDDENYAAEILIKRSGLRKTDYLFAHIQGESLDLIKRRLLNDLRVVKRGESAEIMFHPGYFDEEILKKSSLNYERARDLALALDPDFKKQILKLGFKIVNYSQL